MATATATSHTTRIISLTIAIEDVRYSVDPLDPGECGTRAFRLVKRAADKATYDVIRDTYGIVSCTCPNYIWRHQGTDADTCKHGAALVELGLMTAPMVPPTAPVCRRPSEARPCVACVPASVAKGIETTDGTAIAPDVPTAVLDAPIAVVEALPPAFDLPEARDPGDSLLPPELWGDEWDADRWALGPDPEPATEEPATLDLAGLVDKQADAYRAWPVDAGKMIADALDQLAMQIRMTKATNPADFAARVEMLEADVRQQWEAIGFEAGLQAQAGRLDHRVTCGIFGHPADA
jgi:hypothetical protein